MSAKKLRTYKQTSAPDESVSLLRKLLPHVTGCMCLLVSVAILTISYDSAYAKLTLCQIGVTVLAGLWAALKISERKNPFTKQNMLLLAPFFIYGAWQILSWSLFPYKWETTDEFIRFLLYGTVTALITCEFSVKDVRILIKYIIVAALISFLYGVVQIVAIWIPSADIMEWHGFFDKRVFSTHANPNFFGDFIVFTSFILAAVYLKTKKKFYLSLLGAGILCLIFSETKGAWLAFGAAAVFFAAGYTNLFLEKSRRLIAKINVCALAVLAVAVVFTGIYAAKRFQSVSFRLHTWTASFEMVKDSPILGTGIGSFKVVYPSYRHPQIFYIENSHNTETQHAENEFLEQWVIGGTIGLALSLWIFIFLFRSAYKTIRQSKDVSTRFYLLGFSSAVFGILVHSIVDVSLHFVSSGLLLAVFTGSILALCRGDQTHAEVFYPSYNKPLLYALKIISAALLLAAAVWFTVSFYEIMRLGVSRSFGQILMTICTWGGWILCAGGILYIYGCVLAKTRRPSVPVILAVTVLPIFFFVNWFVANCYYNVSVASVLRLQMPEMALKMFTKAIELNPFQIEYRHYRANTFSRTLDLGTMLIKERGDKDKPSNDYERAINDYKIVLERVPNHVTVYQDIGRLYYSMGQRYVLRSQQAQNQDEFIQFQQLATENMNQARHALEHSLLLDPTNEDTYILLSSMALMKRDFQTAQYWLDEYRRGPAHVTEEEFLSRHKQNEKIESMQHNINNLLATYQNASSK